MTTHLIGIKHLTHDIHVLRNDFFKDDVSQMAKRRTAKGMFFQPYSNRQEFIMNCRHVVMPSMLVPGLIINPISATIVLTVAGAIAGLAALTRRCVGQSSNSFLYQASTAIVNDFCQSVIDLCVLPLSALILLTRGVSTLIKAFDKKDEEYTHPESVFIV